MKIVQVTDLHFIPTGLRLLDIDPRERLEVAIAEINDRHGDADLCVITGDLADRGAPEAYALLRETLAGLRVPHRLLLGNHDHRAHFVAAFGDDRLDDEGFVQSALETERGRFLFLDTLEQGRHDGRYCAARCRWLAGQLARCDAGRPAYLFMHHPPFEIGVPSLDALRLKEEGPLARLLADSGMVRHIFFGHLHRAVSGSWRGMPYSCLPSLVHQVPLDLQQADPVPYNRERPAYGVIFLAADQVTVHVQALGEQPALPADLPRYAPTTRAQATSTPAS